MIGTDAPARWDTVVRACSEAVAVIDHEGVIQLVSPSLERELGRTDHPGPTWPTCCTRATSPTSTAP
jgi:hypothetical protein